MKPGTLSVRSYPLPRAVREGAAIKGRAMRSAVRIQRSRTENARSGKRRIVRALTFRTINFIYTLRVQ